MSTDVGATVTDMQPPSFWENRQKAIDELRREVLMPYFNLVAQLRVTSLHAVNAEALVAESFNQPGHF